MFTETLYTLKKGTEVHEKFDGVVIPIMVPGSLADVVQAAGGTDADVKLVASIEDKLTEAARTNVRNIFNQAHKLNIQKEVKPATFEDGMTVDGLRAIPKEHKYGQVRVRGTGTGAARVKPATVANVVGDDFISSLSPEQRKMWDERMAKLSAKPATAPNATDGPVISQGTAVLPGNGKKK